MKTKSILVSLFALVCVSCIKDYHGDGPKKIEFTEKNYIYEGELYRIYLSSEIENLNKQIQVLNDELANGQGDEETKMELQEAMERSLFLNSALEDIASLEQVGIVLPRPPLPCPRPRNCDFSDLEYLLTPSQTERILIRFYDEKDNLVGGGTLDDLSPLPGAKGALSFSKLMIGNNGGSVASLRIEALNFDGTERIYEIR